MSLRERLTASTNHIDSNELKTEVARLSCCPLDELVRGESVTVVGRIRSVTYTPSENVPTLQAELFDGSGTITLIWLGRRRIAGIEPGRRIVVRGRVGHHDGAYAIYNPWYELRCVA
jgi:RecG-like helicase